MPLRIFPRMLIGFGALFILVVSLVAYTFLQLRHFNEAMRHIIEVENRIVEYDKKLADSMLAQMRYERKYAILKDKSLYEHFHLAHLEFGEYLKKVGSIADTPQKIEAVERLRNQYDRYGILVNEEAGYMQGGLPYDRERYKQEKDEAANGVFEELARLKSYSQQETTDKMQRLKTAGDRAGKVAGILAVAALLAGIGISLYMTKSITRPLTVLVEKTGQIAGGDLTADLDIKSPPEIGELAGAVNVMCDQLRAVDRMKSDFFSSMSHELRTPLTSIKEGTSLMLDGVAGEVSEKQKRLLTIITEESDRLISLVNSQLDLSKMEAGMMPFHFAEADISALIDRVATELEPLALAKGISLNVAHARGIPKVRMDSERILQALRNLVGNAAKFTPAGGEVKVSAMLVDAELQVSVSDTGPGIPQENLVNIFEKFNQGPSGPEKVKGTGLGLALVKQIITAHEGTVWAESELGRGSTFNFVLPVSRLAG